MKGGKIMYFNPNETYDKAIRSQDKMALRTLLVGVIGSDPTFATSEFEEAIQYIRNKSIEINGQEISLNEEYVKQEDEYKKEDAYWDESYYLLNLVWLMDNFAIEERLPDIKKMGKVVYRNKQTMGKTKVENGYSTLSYSAKKEGDVLKKGTVVKATGDDYEEKRLTINCFYGWIKERWYWGVMTVIIIISVLVFIFTAYRPSMNEQFEKESDNQVELEQTLDSDEK